MKGWNNSKYALPETFFNSNASLQGASVPYFKVNAPFFWCPFFLKEYLNDQGRVNEMLNGYSFDYTTLILQEKS